MRFILSILAFVFFLSQGHAEELSGQEFPFEFRDGLIWVEVTVPQSAKPLRFMLDSGAGVSTINLSTAQRLGLKGGRRVNVRSVQTSVAGYWPEHLRASIAEVRLPADYLAVDLSDLSKACAGGLDGLLGADFFRNRIVQIDYQAKKIRLLKSVSANAQAEVLPLEAHTSGIRVPLRVNGGKQQWVRLDTGCASGLQWVTSEVGSNHFSRLPAIGIATLSIPQTETTVQIGKTEFKGVPTGLHEREIFAGEGGLLGEGLLSRFRVVTIDVSGGLLLLERPCPE